MWGDESLFKIFGTHGGCYMRRHPHLVRQIDKKIGGTVID